MFDWKWYLKELKQDKPVKVFSTFSCGGGSTMGYKRAGFQVLGNVEIDPRMNAVYKANHHPKYNYCMDIRDFNRKDDLPDELYRLDILDGSPPCSTFSTAGDREKTWGREKVFREGQKKQVLDDLFFAYLDTVGKLKPKVAVAENVTGLIKGKAKGYVNEIIAGFRDRGYEVQMFRLNAAFMDVPQARERIFFIANNQGYPKLRLNFNHEPITFGKVRTERGKEVRQNTETYKRLQAMRKGDMNLGDITLRINGRETQFTNPINWDNRVAFCLTSNGTGYRAYDRMEMSDGDIVNVSSFPQDYDFGAESPKYVCGMSVPPNMMANIAAEIWKQWLSK